LKSPPGGAGSRIGSRRCFTHTIVDLPQTLLFSATYLKASFPDARIRICGEGPIESLFGDFDRTDFLFVPAHALRDADSGGGPRREPRIVPGDDLDARDPPT
jgi:hypothetical protein